MATRLALDRPPNELPTRPAQDDPLQTMSTQQEDLAEAQIEEADESSGDEFNIEVNFETEAARKVTARKQVDNDTFDQWMRDEEIQLANQAQGDLNGPNPSLLNLDEINKKRIINTPREYQLELFERAKLKNIIAVLPTGSGKTLISVLLLRHVIDEEMTDRANGQPHRISFFLVDKVALAVQQHKVLSNNLDCNVAKFYGDMMTGSGTGGKEFWGAHFKHNKVIVCTADILSHCLHYSFITMDQINLLIFDEAHHAKKEHAYAKIIKNFYADLERNNMRRPRIFGMTASPVDAKTDIATAAAQLEGLLHSEIATVAEPGTMRISSDLESAGTEEVVEYRTAHQAFATPLWQNLNGLIGDNADLKRYFGFTRDCTAILGRWCADRTWQLCLNETEITRLKARAGGHMFKAKGEKLQVSEIDEKIEALEKAEEIILNHKMPEFELSPILVTHKVQALVQTMQKNFQPYSDKCIIFVEQRLVAQLLADLLKQSNLGMPGLKPSVLLGSASAGGTSTFQMSVPAQRAVLEQFREGGLNCLVATSIGEEGLDIPDCNMIVRFDLAKTMIKYVQSKGRARKASSKLFHLIEAGSPDDTQKLLDTQEREDMLWEFCATMPEDRLLKGNDFDIDFFLKKDEKQRSKKLPSGAVLNYSFSLNVLATFVSSLPHREGVVPQCEFVVTPVGDEFQCEAILPDNAPIKNARGRVHSSKQVAKCSAAYEVCLQLIKSKHIDEFLQPMYKKKLPAFRNAQLAISSKKRAQYKMIVKPSLWDQRGPLQSLYLSILQLADPQALERPSRPLVILTRQALPQVAPFPLFFGNGRYSVMECIHITSAINVDDKDLQSLEAFTLRIFYDVFSKKYKSDPARWPFFLAPFSGVTNPQTCAQDKVRDLIDWECIKTVTESEEIDVQNLDVEMFKDCFAVDPHNGARKFWTVGHRPGLKGTDYQLTNAPPVKTRKFRLDGPVDIWDYSISLWSKSRARMARRDDLPVIEAEFIPLRRNLLDEYEKSDPGENRCYLVFQTLKLSTLPVDVVAMAYTLPAIFYKLDSNLIVREACQKLGLAIRPDLALEAMTKDSDNTEEHSEAQVDFQAGMGKNYERLELLGDSFLKMGTSISLFTQKPDDNEFDYHVDRMILICNKNLFNNALILNLQEFVRSKAFNRRIWYPEGLELLQGKQNTSIKGLKDSANANEHALGDKSIADVCEALIGAALLTAQEENNFDMAVKAVTTFTRHRLHRMTTWDEYYTLYEVPKWQSSTPTAGQLDLAQRMEKQFGYKFVYPRLLRCAFLHPSYSFNYERIPNYQRLEFLGDSLLDMVCVEYLFHKFPDADPQWLTEHKMAMVSNQFLSCLCVNLGLHKHLASSTQALPNQITNYVAVIDAAKAEAEAEAERSNLDRSAFRKNYWVQVTEPPKCLADILEAFLGAIFVDSKYDFEQVRRFFENWIRPWFENMHLYDTFANNHPVTALGHLLQLKYKCSHWRLLVREKGVTTMLEEGHAITDTQVIGAVMIHGVVRGHGVATSGRWAKIAAAKEALKLLEEVETVEYYKERFGCSCTEEEVQEDKPMEASTAV